MSDQLSAARKVTEGIREALYMSASFLPVAPRQRVRFELDSNPPCTGAVIYAIPLCFSASFFSAFTARNLSQVHLLGAGIPSFTLQIPAPGLPPAPPMNSRHRSLSTDGIRRNTMKDSSRNIYFFSTTNLPAGFSSVGFETREDRGNPQPTGEARSFSTGNGPGGKPVAVSFTTSRCSEKGCVFPASPKGHGKCSNHWHEQQEPVLFRSRQPTGLLLDPARCLPTDKEYDDSRRRDRRRLANLWEQFQNEGTP